MPKTLSIGSSGPEVQHVQTLLNLLPTLLPLLVADGVFGPKTKKRAVEFQQKSSLVPDGVIGPLTWAALLDLINKLFPGGPPGTGGGSDPNDASRDAIVKTAEDEAKQGGVAAKLRGGIDPANGRSLRLGHDKLIKYFRTSAPNPLKPGTTFFNEDAIRHLTTAGQLAPCPHWCGIFALWAIKASNIKTGTWQIGFGIGSVTGVRQVFDKTQARKGDVGFVSQPFQHHFIIKQIGADGSLVTIEGNSDPNSNFNIKTTRTLSTIDAVYSVFA